MPTNSPRENRYGDKVLPVELDLTRRETIQAAANIANDAELVINNARVLRTTTALDDHAIESLQFEMQAIVFGFIHIAQAFAPVLKANGGGALVQLNSVASMKSE